MQGLEKPLIASGLTFLLFTSFALTALLKRAKITDGFLGKEMRVWVFVSVLAVFMVFEISAPIICPDGAAFKSGVPMADADDRHNGHYLTDCRMDAVANFPQS